jgi:hypothetical protein
MLQREAQLAPHLIEEPEVEVAAQMAGAQVDRLLQRPLGLRQPARLEEDQAQVGPQDLEEGLSSTSNWRPSRPREGRA